MTFGCVCQASKIEIKMKFGAKAGSLMKNWMGKRW
jgi:hypothetical protein